VTVDENAVLKFYTYNDNFDCVLKNTYLSTAIPNGLINAFRLVKGLNETLLGLVLKADDSLMLYTANPQSFTETLTDIDGLWIKTPLCKYDENVRCTLLKENRYNAVQTSHGDVLALVDEVRRDHEEMFFSQWIEQK